MRAALRKLANSSGVIIPKSMLAEIGIDVGDAVDITLEDGRVVPLPRCGGSRGPVGPRRRETSLPPKMTSSSGRNSPMPRMTVSCGEGTA